MQQEIRYCTTPDGVRLAYAVMGKGEPPIVRTSHWFAHVEHDLESPVFRHFLLDLARHHKLLRYDARGIGLSQRDNVELSFDRFVDDLGTVIDAAGLDKVVLFGLSQGGAQAIAYAARHPERVSHLILFGAYSRGAYQRSNPEAEKKKIELACGLIRSGWGGQEESHRQFFTSQFIPDATKELHHSLNELQRVAATPEMAERFLLASTDANVIADLKRIKCPVLVMHSTRDLRVPFSESQEIAAAIPGAKLVPLDTGNHMIMPGEPAHRVMSDAVSDFLGDTRARHLSGTDTLGQKLNAMIVAFQHSWLLKLAAVCATLASAAVALFKLWQLMSS